ncbi:MAG: hypothetical protein AB7F72_01775 [Afipia sp.]
MSDDKLRKMLEDAIAKSDDKASQAIAAQRKLEEETRAGGLALKERLMPRLLAAKEAWADKLNLIIHDNSEKFNVTSQQRVYPSIGIALSAKELAGFSFESHYPGFVSVREGAGRNHGGNVYEFKVEKLEDLTDEKIDQILTVLVNEAHGLKTRR